MSTLPKQIKLNIGSGEQKLKGFINIDTEKTTKPDLVHDITKAALPFKPKTVDVIFCVHNIEHIKMELWPYVFNEFFRVLKPEGMLFLAYPEFEVCAKYFIENHQGKRDFWRACLYGRQLYPSDTHISPVITSEIRNILRRYGFIKFKQRAALPDDPQYTELICYKGFQNDKEHVLRRELFRGHKVTEGRMKKK
jgi:predicted SAM-dependent methyltransferase